MAVTSRAAGVGNYPGGNKLFHALTFYAARHLIALGFLLPAFIEFSPYFRGSRMVEVLKVVVGKGILDLCDDNIEYIGLNGLKGVGGSYKVEFKTVRDEPIFLCLFDEDAESDCGLTHCRSPVGALDTAAIYPLKKPKSNSCLKSLAQFAHKEENGDR